MRQSRRAPLSNTARCVFVLLCLIASEVLAQQPVCTRIGEVYRTECPKETLVNCYESAADCSNLGRLTPGPYPIVKKETKRISWETSSQEVELEGYGECAYKLRCNCADSQVVHWPMYLTPEVDATNWKQDVIDMKADCRSELCPFPSCMIVSIWCNAAGSQILPPRTFRSFGQCPRYKCSNGQCVRDDVNGSYTTPDCSGACGAGGGGGGGGGGETGGGGGCTECDCYYQTTFTYVQQEPGSDCYARYSQTKYVCSGQVQWEGDAVFDGIECGLAF